MKNYRWLLALGSFAFCVWGCSGGGSDKPTPPANGTYVSGHMAGDDVSGARKPKGGAVNGN